MEETYAINFVTILCLQAFAFEWCNVTKCMNMACPEFDKSGKKFEIMQKVASEILAEDILRPHNEKEVQY